MNGRVIRTTAEHPFYVWDKGWTAAYLLKVGDRLRSDDGQTVVVEAVCDSGVEETVYNCRVAEYHTYFVGGSNWSFSVWAHNSCEIVGVTDKEAASLGGALKRIEVDGHAVVESVEAFGSRAGSSFRGRPPLPTSDLDVYVTLKSEFVNSPQKLKGAMDQIHEVTDLFSQVKKFPVQPVIELDTLAATHKLQFSGTSFIPLG